MGAAYVVNGLSVVLQTGGTAVLASTIVVKGVLYSSQSVFMFMPSTTFDEDDGPTRSQLLPIGLSEHSSSQVLVWAMHHWSVKSDVSVFQQQKIDEKRPRGRHDGRKECMSRGYISCVRLGVIPPLSLHVAYGAVRKAK